MGVKTHFKAALGLGFFFFIIYGNFAYAFYFGSILVEKQNINTSGIYEEPYNVGDVIACFFGLVFGM